MYPMGQVIRGIASVNNKNPFGWGSLTNKLKQTVTNCHLMADSHSSKSSNAKA